MISESDYTAPNPLEPETELGAADYRALVEQTPDAILVCLQDRIVYVNPAAVKLSGGEGVEPLLGRSLFRLIDPEDHQALRAQVRALLEGTAPGSTLQCQWRRLDGSVADVEIALSSGSWRGRPATQLAVRDMTAREGAEQELLEEESRLRSVLASSRDVAYRRNLLTGYYDYVSPSAAGVLGIEARHLAELPMESLFERVHPDDRDAITATLGSSAPVGEASMEYRFRGDDGRYRWVEDHFVVRRDRDGTPLSWTGMARDITHRKAGERALRDSEERFRTLADLVPDLLWQSDATGYTTWYNRRWMEYTGQSPAEARGWGWVEVIHPEDREPSLGTYKEAVRTGQPFQRENRIRRRDGVYRWFLARAHPLRGEDGTTQVWFGSATDVHEQRTALEMLEGRVEERTREVRELASMLTVAEQQERRRLARLLHDDLQQLLVSIQVRLALARRKAEQEDREGSLGQIERGLDLLDQALTRTRHLSVELRPPLLEEEGLVPAFEWLKVEMGDLHGLRVDLVAEEEADVVSPQMRVLVFQVVRELLFNITKHANTSNASIELRRDGDGAAITVTDEGQGFDPRTLHRPKDNVASGFGIFSARERLRLQGGDLEVRSEPGQGTRVVVHAPGNVSF